MRGGSTGEIDVRSLMVKPGWRQGSRSQGHGCRSVTQRQQSVRDQVRMDAAAS